MDHGEERLTGWGGADVIWITPARGGTAHGGWLAVVRSVGGWRQRRASWDDEVRARRERDCRKGAKALERRRVGDSAGRSNDRRHRAGPRGRAIGPASGRRVVAGDDGPGTGFHRPAR